MLLTVTFRNYLKFEATTRHVSPPINILRTKFSFRFDLRKLQINFCDLVKFVLIQKNNMLVSANNFINLTVSSLILNGKSQFVSAVFVLIGPPRQKSIQWCQCFPQRQHVAPRSG